MNGVLNIGMIIDTSISISSSGGGVGGVGGGGGGVMDNG